MQQPLTEVQERVYVFIKKYMREHGFAPTIRDIMEQFGFKSSNSVAVHLTNLKKKGYIVSGSKDKMTARTIRLVEDILSNNGNVLGRTIDDNEIKQAVVSVRDKGFAIDYNLAHNLLAELGFTITNGRV